MKETTEKQLLSSTSASLTKLEEAMAKDGWRLATCRNVTLVTFEREIPDPPPAEEHVGPTIPSTYVEDRDVILDATDIANRPMPSEAQKGLWNPEIDYPTG